MPADKKKDSSSDGDLYKLYEKAMQALYKSDFDKARELFERIEERFPEETEVQARVRVLKRVCDSQSPKADKTSPESLFDLGVYHHNRANYDEALKNYEAALKKAKEDTWHIRYAIAATKAQQGNSKDALAALKKAISENREAKFFATHDPDFRVLGEQDDFRKLIQS